MTPKQPDEILVRLRAEGPGPDAAVRLRRWLKQALRTAGLRAVSVEPSPPPPPRNDGAGGTDDR